jgi:aerobic-type carbon monoxide dehydrogenase small subunit (CoxS/CutS family)
MMTKLQVNGQEVSVEASDDTPLLWILRDKLKLTGSKYGCGVGLCGACTVHIDGTAIPSCSVSLASAAGQNITTIEGLGMDSPHPVQQAWIEEQVPQCGYCQSGFIMAAAALLTKNPKPSDQDIDTALARNLCRCGTYLRVRRAIHNAAQKIALESPR